MIRLHELLSARTEFFTVLKGYAQAIIAYPTPIRIDSVDGVSSVEVPQPLFVQTFNFLRTQGDEDLVLKREAQAICLLHDRLLDLWSFSRNLASDDQEKLKAIFNSVENKGVPFEQRLITLKNNLQEDWLKEPTFASINSLSTLDAKLDAKKEFNGIIQDIKLELGWLVGNELEKDFLAKYGIPPFGIFKRPERPEDYKYWITIDENGVFKEFNSSIVDRIILLARDQDKTTEEERGKKAKALYDLNAALLELDIYTHDSESAPHRAILNPIVELAKTNGMDFATHLQRIQQALTTPDVENLVLEDKEFARIRNEVFAGIALLGIGYLIAKGVDMLVNDNSFRECVFFKDLTNSRLKEVEKQVGKLLPPSPGK